MPRSSALLGPCDGVATGRCGKLWLLRLLALHPPPDGQPAGNASPQHHQYPFLCAHMRAFSARTYGAKGQVLGKQERGNSRSWSLQCFQPSSLQVARLEKKLQLQTLELQPILQLIYESEAHTRKPGHPHLVVLPLPRLVGNF